MLEQARAELEVATGDRISMEQRVDSAKQAFQAMVEHAEQTLRHAIRTWQLSVRRLKLVPARFDIRATGTGCLSRDKPVRCAIPCMVEMGPLPKMAAPDSGYVTETGMKPIVRAETIARNIFTTVIQRIASRSINFGTNG